MKTVSIKELSQGGASRVVREAESGPVLISKNNEPAAWLLSSKELAQVAAQTGASDVHRSALQLIAVRSFDSGALSMGRAGELAGISLVDFIELCERLHVPVLREPAEGVEREVDDFEAWLQSVRQSDPGAPRSAGEWPPT